MYLNKYSSELPLGFVFLLIFLLIQPAAAFAQTITIKDTVLEESIRSEINQFADPLTKADFDKLTSLYVQSPLYGISSLEGLEHAGMLRSLMLPGQVITDLEPLKTLTNLNFLAISGNQIENLTPLSSLTRLEKLIVSNNQIRDLKPLAELDSLTDLLASHNRIDDLTPLADLKLEWLNAGHNQIISLEPLRAHPTLTHLYLDNNQIKDIRVLTSLPKLKQVSVHDNPLDDTAQSTLEALKLKGVEIVEETTGKPTEPSSVSVLLDAEILNFDAAPVLTNGSTLVQARPFYEELGLTVTWEEETQTIFAVKDDIQIQMRVGSAQAYLNGTEVTLPAAPALISDYTFVPLRFLAESTGCRVEWDADYNQAIVKSKQVFTTADNKAQLTTYGKWTQLETDEGFIQLALKSFNLNELAVITEDKKEYPEITSLDEYVNLVKDNLSTDEAITIIKQVDMDFQGRKAKQITSLFDDGFDTHLVNSIVFETEEEWYEVSYSVLKDYKDAHTPEVLEILDSFTFLPN
ncbi:stalk domain-containing protein [Paenibacillus sp. FJAT-26967]|uniref:stalk domain-containing protein n=1 Tax=Paenibacillus sp. FJAT-26967 TaxID=1729690 RepID=UPI000837BCDC|nr:stalk domain-containing protein [Paenibacillus sp. FJAT-26967]